ncbi:MAG: phosphoribosylanthranilate isomerase, partial [Candidatus Anammoxibacter sp.]
MVRVKICGITNITDAENAVAFGADAIGFVFAESPRKISKEDASSIIKKLPPFITCVALFVNEDVDKVKDICEYCNIYTVQFHGNETQDYLDQFPNVKIIKAIRVQNETDLLQLDNFRADAYLIDSYSKGKMGGTGTSFDWNIIKTNTYNKDFTKSKRIIIAGGLNPENVNEAIKLTEPFGVDTSSGVESSPGVKDERLVLEFI